MSESRQVTFCTLHAGRGHSLYTVHAFIKVTFGPYLCDRREVSTQALFIILATFLIHIHDLCHAKVTMERHLIPPGRCKLSPR